MKKKCLITGIALMGLLTVNFADLIYWSYQQLVMGFLVMVKIQINSILLTNTRVPATTQ